MRWTRNSGVEAGTAALQFQEAAIPLAPQQVARRMREALGLFGAQGGYGQGRPRLRDTKTAAAVSLRKPAHRLVKGLTQNCTYVLRCFGTMHREGIPRDLPRQIVAVHAQQEKPSLLEAPASSHRGCLAPVGKKPRCLGIGPRLLPTRPLRNRLRPRQSPHRHPPKSGARTTTALVRPVYEGGRPCRIKRH